MPLPKNISFPQQTLATIPIPTSLPQDLQGFLKQVVALTPIRSSSLSELKREYESDDDLVEKFRPKNVKSDFWRTTKELMLHMNTTKIAMRSLAGVYSGQQTRKIDGKGKYVEELRQYLESSAYQTAAEATFVSAALYGTAARTPCWDYDADELDSMVHDPVTTRLYADSGNVKRLEALVEIDSNSHWLRYLTREGSGILHNGDKDGEHVTYGKPLPYLLTAVAYGEDKRAHGDVYGASLVKETPGYNRILTNCYYCLGLLIKWQSRSLLTIMSGEKGGADAMPKALTNVAGVTAMLFDKDAKAQFISPQAAFDQILAVVNSYLTFLAVLLGLPKSVFTPQDNVSAQSARLEGAPLLSSLRKLSRNFSEYEREFVFKAAAFLHLRDGHVLTLRELRDLYKPSIDISPWDYTDDINANAASIISLVNANLVRMKDAVRRVNPRMTEEEIDAHLEAAQKELNEQIERDLEALAAAQGAKQEPPAA